MAVNDQYRPGQEPFGMGGVASTGAPGTATNPDTSVGAVVGSPAVVVNYASSQAPIAHVDVLAGDTCSLSSDAPVPVSGDPMSGLTLADVCETGAGLGHAGGPGNPTAVGVPSLVAQAAAARRPS